MDRDLASIQQARDCLERARVAADAFASTDQAAVDRIVLAMGRAAERAADALARHAVDETGMGRFEDKRTKNRFAAVDVRDYILPLRTAGIVRELPDARVKELAVPMGVVVALIPTTNPTSTAIYKALIAVKARNAIVCSPHPRAVQCTAAALRVVAEAARASGAPADLIQCLDDPTPAGTDALMRHRHTAVILATGGSAMVRAAYASGRPAYGVGPGNVPAIVERTADVPRAVADVVTGKCFDQGLLCSAENALIVDAPVEGAVRQALGANRAVVVRGDERQRLEHAMRDPATGAIAADIVGQPAPAIAQRAGIEVPADTRVLVVECREVGVTEFFSREKLSPVLALYVDEGWERCCERAIALLEYGGIGHSLVIHSHDEHVIERFFFEKPAFRILVNTVAAVGAVGYTTGLAPAMTLGPGTWGGSSTSDNITPLHLVNVKRLAYGTRPFTGSDAPAPVPPADVPTSNEADDVAEAVRQFLAERRTVRRP